MLRRIYGPVKANGQLRIRYNNELYEIYGEPDLAKCIKLKRLKWAGQVQRLEGTRIPKKVLKAKFGGVRSVGTPRKSWEDGNMWCNRMLPDICVVAIGSWPLMIEHCGCRS
jgi:hypothetical protein